MADSTSSAYGILLSEFEAYQPKILVVMEAGSSADRPLSIENPGRQKLYLVQVII